MKHPETRTVARTDPETRFDRSARLLLLGALLFIALDLGQLAYRFTLPTEGWAIDPDSANPDAGSFYPTKNIVGAPSPMQAGDALHIIGGIPADQILNSDSLGRLRPAGWQAGGHVQVTVIRQGQSLSFDLPIVNWTFAAWLRWYFADVGNVLGGLTTLILFGVGLLTVLKRPGSLAGRYLFLFGLADLAMLIAAFLPDGLGMYLNPLAGFGRALFRNVIFAYLFGPSLLGFALTFPRPKAFVQGRLWLLGLPFVLGSSAPALLFIAPPLSAIGFPITLAMILAAIAALVHSGLTMRDAISRAQLRWAVGGMVLGLALFTLNYWPFFTGSRILGEIMLAAASLGLPVIGISLAVAILRYRLFDIDLIIRRTLVYAILTALLGLVYLGGVTLLQSVFTALTGQSSPAALVISTLLIAALFSPLRTRIQGFIDQRFYRHKYDAEKALAHFAAAARSETNLEALTGSLLGVVTETIEPERLGLWLKEHGQ